MSAHTDDLAAWRVAISTLPDGPFFDLMRVYLGDIKTPFNKQRLMEDLESFLGRRDVQASLIAFLDDMDRRVLTAIQYLEEPELAELSAFLGNDLAYADLYALLINLEERLLVYRRLQEGRRILAINPLLINVLSPFFSDPSPLFPEHPRAASHAAVALVDDSILLAASGFLRSRAEPFKTDGSLKKRIADNVASIFTGPSGERQLLAALDVLRQLGMINQLGTRSAKLDTLIDEERLSAFAELSAQDRLCYYAASLCFIRLDSVSEPSAKGEEPISVPRNVEAFSHRHRRGELTALAGLFSALCSELKDYQEYDDSTLARLLEAQRRSFSLRQGRRSGTADRLSQIASAPAFAAEALGALVDAGVLERTITERFGLIHKAYSSKTAPNPAATMDSAFTVFLRPEDDFPKALAVSRFLDLREAGVLTRWELTRASALRAFNTGATLEETLDVLKSACGKDAPNNVIGTLRDWRERYDSIALYRGLVLAMDESQRHLLDTPELALLVEHTFAPGVVLLKAGADDALIQTLSRLGADIVASPRQGKTKALSDAYGMRSPQSAFPRLNALSGSGESEDFKAVSDDSSIPLAGENVSAEKHDSAAVSERLRSLREALSAKRLPRDQYDELSGRISRRVIISETQLTGTSVRYERLEAGGLDYVGKVRVADQALAANSLIEVHWRGPKGEPKRLFGFLKALDKRGGELFLVVDGSDSRRYVVPMGKIGLIKRLKRSIFE